MAWRPCGWQACSHRFSSLPEGGAVCSNRLDALALLTPTKGPAPNDFPLNHFPLSKPPRPSPPTSTPHIASPQAVDPESIRPSLPPRLDPPIPNVLYRNNELRHFKRTPNSWVDSRGPPTCWASHPWACHSGRHMGGRLEKQPRATNLLGLVKHSSKYTDVW